MSTRVHVVGACGASKAELQAALDRIGDEQDGSERFRIGASGRWAWAHASVWHVGGEEIDEALDSLDVPALRVTSDEGILWTLTLVGPGKAPFRGVHHFLQVGLEPTDEPEQEGDDEFPDDEIEVVAGIHKFIPELQFLWDSEEEARLVKQAAEEKSAHVVGLDDYTSFGAVLPPEVVDEMKREPARAQYTSFLAHGRQIVDSLREFGFTFDRDRMLKLLTVGPLTEWEEDADVGNMPRFLRALGIDGLFEEESMAESENVEDDNEIEDDDDGDRASGDWSNYPPGKLTEAMTALRSETPLAEIRDGSVRISNAVLLHLLTHLCSENPTTSVLVSFPEGTDQPARPWQLLDDLEVQRLGERWQFCFETESDWWSEAEADDLEFNELSQSLGTLPDGTRVEIHFAAKGLSERSHGYAGVYRNQQLELEQAYPPVSAAVLNEALELVEQTIGSHSIALASPQEELAVRKSYQCYEDEVPRIRNGKIMPEYGSRIVVVRTLFFERFDGRGPWDIAGARTMEEESWDSYDKIVHPEDDDYELDDEYDGELDDDDEEDDDLDSTSIFQGMLAAMNEGGEEGQGAKTVPHSDEVIYEGGSGQFFRASMSDLGHVSEESLRSFDATMEQLGFRSIGDSVGDADQRQEITRCYCGHSQAIALRGFRNEDDQFVWAEVSNGAELVDFSGGTYEFHTHFEDGTTLVTSSIYIVNSKPDAGIFVRSYEDASVSELWDKHLQGIDRFKQHRDTVPIDHREFGDLASFVALIDRLFCRFIGEA